MDKQTIFFIIGVIVLLILVIDGIRRMRNSSPRYQQRQYQKNKVEIDDISSAELPNGGSRKVSSDSDESPMDHITDIDDLEQDLDEHVPVLMDSVENIIDQLDEKEQSEGDAQLQTSFDLKEAPVDEDDVLLNNQNPASYSPDIEDTKYGSPQHSAQDEMGGVEPAFSAVEDDIHYDEPMTATDSDAVLETEQQETKKSKAQDVLVLNVTSNDESFQGLELYHAMIAGGLRFGDMNIFHSSNQQGQIQFSLVNSVQPGTFDLESINQFSTPGVSLFLQLPCEVDAVTAFEQMKNVAHFLAKELNGQVRDDAQIRLTEQTTEHYRDRIRQFQRAQLLEQA